MTPRKAPLLRQPWQRIDSTTVCDGWTVHWYLTDQDGVLITGATTPDGAEAALPDRHIGLGEADKYLPKPVCEQVRAEKYDDCPRMLAFLARLANDEWRWRGR